MEATNTETTPRIRQVVRRSAITARSTKFGWQYTYAVTLDDGETLVFQGMYANTSQKAINSGIKRSQKMIEKGYQDGM